MPAEHFQRGQPRLGALQVGAHPAEHHLPAAGGQVRRDAGELALPAVVPASQPGQVGDQQLRVGSEGVPQWHRQPARAGPGQDAAQPDDRDTAACQARHVQPHRRSLCSG